MAKKNKSILVQGEAITLLSRKGEEDYISLTDIMKRFDDEFSIYSWMRNRNTVEFLGVWEQLHNPLFKGNEFVTFKNQAGANNFNLTPRKWITNTQAIGMVIKAGRYGGGTFAHRDIAINFCYWLSPTFQLYLIKEFQRLKEIEEKERFARLDWSVKRMLTKVNYTVHTDAVKEVLIPKRLAKGQTAGLVYASEADIINVALFGMTAKQWRTQNPNAKGNIRDHEDTTAEHLIVLSNLEAINADLIRHGLSQDERVIRLNEAAITQMRSILSSPSLPSLPPSDKL